MFFQLSFRTINKNSPDASKIRTRIVRVEFTYADHLTTPYLDTPVNSAY